MVLLAPKKLESEFESESEFYAPQEMRCQLGLSESDRKLEELAFADAILLSTFEKVKDLYRLKNKILGQFPSLDYEITFFENVQDSGGIEIFNLLKMYEVAKKDGSINAKTVIIAAVKNYLLKSHQSTVSKLSRREYQISKVNDLLRFSIRSKKPIPEIGGLPKIASDMAKIYKLLPDYWNLDEDDFEVFVNQKTGFSKVDVKFTTIGELHGLPYTINLEVQYDTVENAKALKREHDIYETRRELSKQVASLIKSSASEKYFLEELDNFVADLIISNTQLSQDNINNFVSRFGKVTNYDLVVQKLLEYKELAIESTSIFSNTNPSVSTQKEADQLVQLFKAQRPVQSKIDDKNATIYRQLAELRDLFDSRRH
jgi:hypothetical protein